MKVALFSSAGGDKWRIFVNDFQLMLLERGIEIAVVVLDDQVEKGHRLRHAWNVAKRQARVADCFVPQMICRIVVYKGMTRLARRVKEHVPVSESVAVVRVPTLNSAEAVEAVRSRACGLVCLMGTRVISKEALTDLSVPVINIHSSDPSFVRGGPPVIWEVLDGRESIALTIHEAVERVDTGAILRQAAHPILYAGGLGKTVGATMLSAQPKVARLFFDVITEYKEERLERTEFTPGPLRVTPSVAETLRADRFCRRSRRAGGVNAESADE